jgi:hypothetical protein
MPTQTLYPGLNAAGTSLTVYAEDGVTLITSAGAVVTLIQEFAAGPFVLPRYYRDKCSLGLLRTSDPLSQGGAAVAMPPASSNVAYANVRDFGAVGNDDQSLTNVTPYLSDATISQQTRDGDAINSAIRFLREAGGGTLYIPRGTYRVYGNLETINASIRFVGDGDGVTVIKNCDTSPTNAQGYGLFRTGDPSAAVFDGPDEFIDCAWEDMTLDGNGAVRAEPDIERRSYCLNLRGFVRCKLKNVSIVNSPCDNLLTYYPQPNMTANAKVELCFLSAVNCVFGASWRNSATLAYGWNQQFSNCRFIDGGGLYSGVPPRACVDIEPDDKTKAIKNITFTNCTFDTAGNALLTVSWAGNTKAVGCTFLVRGGSATNLPWPIVYNTSELELADCSIEATDPATTSYIYALHSSDTTATYWRNGKFVMRGCTLRGVGMHLLAKNIHLENVSVLNSAIPVLINYDGSTQLNSVVIRNLTLTNVVDTTNLGSGPLAALMVKSSVSPKMLDVDTVRVFWDTAQLPVSNSYLAPFLVGAQRKAFGISINPTISATTTFRMANVHAGGYFRDLPNHFGYTPGVDWFRDFVEPFVAPSDTAGTACAPGAAFYKNCSQRGDV